MIIFNIKFIARNFYLGTGLCVISLLSQYAYSHGMTEADKLAIIEGGNLSFMQLGATHMLTGYDHLLFVFGIIFFLRTFRDIVKYVTAFTLGHSVTLIFATFNAIQLNYFIIDAVIGLSVCYIAFVNLDGFRKYLNINPPNMIVMIFSLGLIHGLGLSTRLQELPLSEDGLLLNIISFNAGIELGQIFALLLMILAIDVWRKTQSFKQFSVASNYALICAGALLFLMQMHGYAHVSNPEEFAIAITPTQERVDNSNLAAVSPPSLEQTTWDDSINITIPARSGKEYKFYLMEGALFDYTWETDGEALYYDFHGEPEGDTTGYFKSFEENTSNQASGSLTAPFEGIHGWYWQNDTSSPVEIVLKANGNYKRLDIAEKPLEEIAIQVPVAAASEDANTQLVTPQKDMITISIPARGSKEYKFYLEKGATFDYAWESDGDALFYDFHGEPEGDTTGFFESFEKDTSSQASGSFTAPFTGIHGWYWKNNSTSSVQITLLATGEYQRTDLNN
jgi:hypothetical protein